MQGIQPSPHDTTKDYAVVFYAKDFVKEDDTIQVTDVLLFFASMETVLGGDKTIDKFDVWFNTWWDSCDIKNKKIKVCIKHLYPLSLPTFYTQTSLPKHLYPLSMYVKFH